MPDACPAVGLLQVSKAQLAAAEAERARLQEQVTKQADELRILRLRMDEQGTQLCAAHSSQQVQSQELGDKYRAEAQVGNVDLRIAKCQPASACVTGMQLVR
jgi:hypothetical protein